MHRPPSHLEARNGRAPEGSAANPRPGAVALALCALFCLLAGRTSAAGQTVNEYVTDQLQRMKTLSPDQRTELQGAIQERFADYGNKVVHPEINADEVNPLMRMIAEGLIDENPPDRIADVSFAAFQAISRYKAIRPRRPPTRSRRPSRWWRGSRSTATRRRSRPRRSPSGPTATGPHEERRPRLDRGGPDPQRDVARVGGLGLQHVQVEHRAAAKSHFDTRKYAAWLFAKLPEGRAGPRGLDRRGDLALQVGQARGRA